MRLFSSAETPMKTARYRWRVDGRSGQGETHTGWVIIPPAQGGNDLPVTLEWGPPDVSTSLANSLYPYEKEVRFADDRESVEEQAARKLEALNCHGELADQVAFFMSEMHLSGPAFCDGRLSRDLWVRIKREFDSRVSDPDEPPECRDDD